MPFGVLLSLTLAQPVYSDQGVLLDKQQCSVIDTSCHQKYPAKQFLIPPRTSPPRKVAQRLSGNGPMPNIGLLSSATLTSMFTNTHLVLGRSMLSILNRLLSWSFNHPSPAAKVIIQGEQFCGL